MSSDDRDDDEVTTHEGDAAEAYVGRVARAATRKGRAPAPSDVVKSSTSLDGAAAPDATPCDAALDLVARLGRPVRVVHPHSGAALCAPTTDAAAIAQAFAARADAGIELTLGDGFCAVVADQNEDADATRLRLQLGPPSIRGACRDAWLFRCDATVAGRALGPGVVLLGEGFVLVPPSRTSDDHVTWRGGAFVEPAPLPVSLGGAAGSAADDDAADVDPLDELFERARTDAGALFTAAAVAVLFDLRGDDPAEYQRRRAWLKAEKLNVSVAALDATLDRHGRRLDDAAREAHRARVRAQLAAANDGASALPAPPEGSHERAGFGYAMRAGVTEMQTRTPDGDARVVTIAWASGLILADCAEFDGVDETRWLEVETTSKGRTTRTRVPAGEYSRMDWLVTRVGADAALAAGAKARDHVRAAWQLLSTPVRRRIYTFTGWHRFDDGWRYLHAGGAVGGEAEVRITHGNLGLLALPPARADDALRDGVAACLELWFCGPRELTVPLFSMPWRAGIGQAHTTVLVQAEPMVGKTTVAVWVQAHSGAGFGMRALPETWESTQFGILASLATAGDCVLLLDDFTWNGTSDDDGQRRKLNAVVRPVFGGTSKTKGTIDSRVKKDRPSRSMPLITSEAFPKQDSLLSRMVVLPMTARLPLTAAQLELYDRRAADGVYAGTMAAFLAWLAPQRDRVLEELPERTKALAAEFLALTGRPRGSREVAELAVGARLFLDFAVAVGALSPARAAQAWDDARAGFAACATLQAETQASEDVVARCLRYARSAIAGGRAHLAGKDGAPPRQCTAWGWHRRSDVETADGAAVHEAKGARLGYTDGNLVWLNRDELLAVVRQLAKEHGEPLQIDGRGLADRMHSRKLLTKVDAYADGRLKSKTTRLMVGGTHMSGFLEISVDTFRNEGEGGPAEREPGSDDDEPPV